MCRKYGATMAWTPMVHSRLFLENKKYRKTVFTTCEEDRPLAVQFCANDPAILLAAAKLVEDKCDAIDINLGCPQGIARRGNYGAFLGDQWDIVKSLVEVLAQNLSIPVFCKIRILNSIETTVEYAKMIEKAGCTLLTVHGRTIDQKGRYMGLADFEYIREVKRALSIPVLSNGNVRTLEEADESIRITETDGMMSACGILTNPALFSGLEIAPEVLANEYLAYCAQYPVGVHIVRGHLFKILLSKLHSHVDLRDSLNSTNTIEECAAIVNTLAERLKLEPSETAIELDESTSADNEEDVPCDMGFLFD
uniref:tRNA-dihydrouridine synthase n=1 Tax=Vannella robusta TaxID=1487602 RepID=A0A7S4MEC7_9EUKA